MKTITLPGLIDPHVHLRDMGLNYKEDFFTGTSAALAGGYTTIIDMPNNKAPIFTFDALNEKIKIAKERIACNVGFYFGTDGHNLEEFNRVKDLVMGLKVYMNETTGNFLIDCNNLESIFRAWPEDGGPILLHAEKEAVPFAIKVVEKTKKKTHFCHVSLEEDLSEILNAKEKGLRITCGVTPHHLFLTIDDLEELKGLGIMKPPLATKSDQDFLWSHISEIDVVESDHAPHSIEEKKGKKPAYGIPGLETSLPLLLTAVAEGKLTINGIKRLCHDGPKKLLGITLNSKDETVINLEEEWVIENKHLKTKCGWSSFSGRKVIGKINEVYLKGQIAYNGNVLVKPGEGKILK